MDWLRRAVGGDQPERRNNEDGASRQDEEAVRRYRYLLRTAPPEAIEQAHAEAFAQLTQEQRRQVLTELSAQVPEYERRGVADDPQSLARMATRAEMRQPGTLERSLGGSRGPSFGGILAGSLLASVAGAFVGTAIAERFFDDSQSAQDSYADETEADMESGEGINEGGMDLGGGFGDDFGHGDFGDL